MGSESKGRGCMLLLAALDSSDEFFSFFDLLALTPTWERAPAFFCPGSHKRARAPFSDFSLSLKQVTNSGCSSSAAFLLRAARRRRKRLCTLRNDPAASSSLFSTAAAGPLCRSSSSHLLPPTFLSLSLSHKTPSQVVAAAATTLAVLWAAHALLGLGPAKKRPVWLVDFECYRVPERLRAPRDLIVKAMRRKNLFTEENILFQEAILDRSGLGDATGLSDAILRMNEGDVKTSLRDSLDETEMIMYEIVDDLLKKTGRDPKEIDAVITSCSCFAPTPSMAAMLVNKFRMRQDVLTYSMAGMGCSSSLVCIDLAKHLLQALPNRRILVVNHENITNNWSVVSWEERERASFFFGFLFLVFRYFSFLFRACLPLLSSPFLCSRSSLLARSFSLFLSSR